MLSIHYYTPDINQNPRDFCFKLNYSMYTMSTQNFPVLCKSGTVFV